MESILVSYKKRPKRRQFFGSVFFGQFFVYGASHLAKYPLTRKKGFTYPKINYWTLRFVQSDWLTRADRNEVRSKMKNEYFNFP